MNTAKFVPVLMKILPTFTNRSVFRRITAAVVSYSGYYFILYHYK